MSTKLNMAITVKFEKVMILLSLEFIKYEYNGVSFGHIYSPLAFNITIIMVGITRAFDNTT